MLPARAESVANTAFSVRGNRGSVLRYQGGADGVQRGAARKLGPIQLAPTLFRPLPIVVQKTGGIDNKTQITSNSGHRRRAFQARPVLQFDAWIASAAEPDHLPELPAGASAMHHRSHRRHRTRPR
jgi:hypothetical protein